MFTLLHRHISIQYYMHSVQTQLLHVHSQKRTSLSYYYVQNASLYSVRLAHTSDFVTTAHNICLLYDACVSCTCEYVCEQQTFERQKVALIVAK